MRIIVKNHLMVIFKLVTLLVVFSHIRLVLFSKIISLSRRHEISNVNYYDDNSTKNGQKIRYS